MRRLISIDLYAKVMLTVIAICLVWISVRDVPFIESLTTYVSSEPTSSPALTDENQVPPTTQPAVDALEGFLQQEERRAARNGADPRTVTAGAFVLLDEHGKKRARWAMSSGMPLMQFYDESGQSRISISYSATNGPRIELAGPGKEAPKNESVDEEFNRLMGAQRQRVVLMINKEGGPQIGVTNENGEIRGYWNESGLRLFDTQGRYRSSFGITNGQPVLAMQDVNGTDRLGIGLYEDGGPSIRLRDYKGMTRAAIGVTDLEVTKTGETRRTAPSNISLFDKAGKSLWQSPG